MKSWVSNRAVTNKNDYIKCLARYLSCVSSAQSTFKGGQWKYIVCTIILKCSLKGTSHNEKEWKLIHICLLKPTTLYVDQSERTFSFWK